MKNSILMAMLVACVLCMHEVSAVDMEKKRHHSGHHKNKRVSSKSEEEEFNDGDGFCYHCVGGETGFEQAVSAEDVLLFFGSWGLNYKNGTGLEAARYARADIAAAIQMNEEAFGGFCNDYDLDSNRREAAAFFANVKKETGGLSEFLEGQGHLPPGIYCTANPLSGAPPGMVEAGMAYPCRSDKSYVGRGALQLTWNTNYARFSEFLYGDQSVLLDNPDLVFNDMSVGWAATLWFWMTPQAHGGQCPPKQLDGFLESDVESCHGAMDPDGGGGFSKTIRIINGGYECCSTSSARDSPVIRIQDYLKNVNVLGITPDDDCDDDLNCDVTSACPLVHEFLDRGCPMQGSCHCNPADVWLKSGKKMQVQSYACDARCGKEGEDNDLTDDNEPVCGFLQRKVEETVWDKGAWKNGNEDAPKKEELPTDPCDNWKVEGTLVTEEWCENNCAGTPCRNMDACVCIDGSEEGEERIILAKEKANEPPSPSPSSSADSFCQACNGEFTDACNGQVQLLCMGFNRDLYAFCDACANVALDRTACVTAVGAYIYNSKTDCMPASSSPAPGFDTILAKQDPNNGGNCPSWTVTAATVDANWCELNCLTNPCFSDLCVCESGTPAAKSTPRSQAAAVSVIEEDAMADDEYDDDNSQDDDFESDTTDITEAEEKKEKKEEQEEEQEEE